MKESSSNKIMSEGESKQITTEQNNENLVEEKEKKNLFKIEKRGSLIISHITPNTIIKGEIYDGKIEKKAKVESNDNSQDQYINSKDNLNNEN